MSIKNQLPKNIDRALNLDGSADSIKQYYAEWSKTYDKDVGGNHVAPLHMVRVLQQWLANERPEADISQLTVMDVGCGTGLVGTELAAVGFIQIDGCDLSLDMIQQAAKLGLYRELTADVDIHLDAYPKWNGQYDMVTCCGVFTLGHVRPESLVNMLRFVKPGGLLMATTRMAYYESTDYQQVNDDVQQRGLADLVLHLENAPYTHDSDAHYWLYSRRAEDF